MGFDLVNRSISFRTTKQDQRKEWDMAYADLRAFIARLEGMGELARVKQEVNWKYEVGAWLRNVVDSDPPGPALLFENIKGYDRSYRIFSGGLGTCRRFALALELDPNKPIREIINVYKDRMATRIKPTLVSTGPVKECTHVGDDVDIFEFPTPWWTPRDGGRFIGCWHGVLSKEAVTGRRNLGMYRVQIHERNICTIGFLPYAHLGYHFAQREEAGQPLDVAVVIGADETIPMVAASGIPKGVDEYDLAGALRQEPIELVKCETVDLEVPANAEIVLEGKLYTDRRIPEGPFGEYTGYHGGSIRMRPVFEVTAICHRRDPIYRGALGGKPVTEWSRFGQIQTAANGLRLYEDIGPAGVTAINCVPEASANNLVVIQMKPYYIGHARDVGRMWMAGPMGNVVKVIVIVDEDIDPFDLGQVWWAVATRTQGNRDFEVHPYGRSSRSDPSIPRDRGEYTDVVLIDATKKLDYPYVEAWAGHWAPVCMPPREIMELARMKWRAEMEGEAVPPGEILRKQKEVDEVVHPKWEHWRAKYYTLSEEDKSREIARSYPHLKKDLE
jgi:4-hydroxy-3-polyprenylbenzoate decarboxylase